MGTKVAERDLTLGGAHTMQCAGNVLQSCTPEIYMVLLANITSINSIAIISSLSYCTDEIKVRPRNNLSVSCRVPGI